VLAAACRGRLRIAREIALGTESLVEALTREIRPAGGGIPITLTSEKARELLWRVGVPTREATVVESSGLTGDALLPVMQPVLQRWVVELRQSLRFGLEEAERAGATLHGLGAGSGVPRLTKVIADQMGLALAGVTGAAGTNDSKAGAISSFLECPPGVGMLPRTLRTERAVRRLRRGLLLGAGAAVALIATDAVMTRMELTRRTADLAQAQTKLEASKSATALRDQVVAAQGGLVAARQRMAVRLGSLPAWDAAMAMLSKQTPPTIKLSEVHLGFDSGHPYVRLAGRTVLGSQGDSNALLKSFMDTLAGVPIVHACRLGATQRSDTDAGPIQTFEMTLTLVEMPAGSFSQGVSVAGAATKENTP
jgi:Tfp pilus assembly protein PilN